MKEHIKTLIKEMMRKSLTKHHTDIFCLKDKFLKKLFYRHTQKTREP